jgi:cyclopropane fatty-acyl-phospholipid synthase-like methyltransferase
MNQENTVLDIGSNFGFFTVEFALYCKLVHGIEPNPWLNKIGEKAAEYLGVLDKVDFFNEKFDDFKIPGCVNGYDVILSLAAFFTQDGRERTDAGKYFRKVNSLLSTNGDFFYESTSYTQSAEDPHFVAKNAAISSIKIEMSPLKIWETQSGSEGYFRSFVIAKKSL